MKPDDIALARIVALGLVGKQQSTPLAVVHHLGCLQGQDLPGALLSVALRTAGRSLDAVRTALNTGEIVRSWPMRGTLHLVAAEDIGWMCALTAPRMLLQTAKRRQELGLDETMMTAASDLVREAIRARGPLSRAEVLELWTEPGFVEVPGRGYHLLALLSYTGLLVQGPLRGKNQLFCLMDEWVTQPRQLTGEEAIGEWVRRYFISHGPATLADFVRWTGLKVGEAKRGLALVADSLVSVDWGGSQYWFDQALPDAVAEQRKAAAELMLLPGFDELILGYKDRSPTLAPEHEQLVVPGRNGVFRPTIVDRGTVRGVWRGRGKKFVPEAFPGVKFPAASRLERAWAALPAEAV